MIESSYAYTSAWTEDALSVVYSLTGSAPALILAFIISTER